MIAKITLILKDFNDQLNKVNNVEQLEEIKQQFTGKSSPLNEILKMMKDADATTKQELGKAANEARAKIANKLNLKLDVFNREILNRKLLNDKIDVSKPGTDFSFGTKHPLNLVIEEISDIFTEIGYEMINGTEVELDLYNFQNLNLPLGHPARDMQDTFYINEETVMRTHCTNMTSRMLSKLAQEQSGETKNLAAISYGNVYRRDDDDATHSHQFMQIDGFAVGPKISFANLKWVLKYMCKRLFNDSVNIRLRPSYFPFTEPSVEVDVSCFKCNGAGCALCKQSGWIEILGSGMINQQVLELNGLDPEKITGLAFGIGIERIAMLKFGVTNIRAFYENNVKFLDQFKFYGE
ncbi:phenylalanyl-tRNA synthetase subunit alpha [Williamsoniiplasma somnilux]|uniref:Phenylalanine--tRNA ligase alpha subunit n=1 Tax=Williamsoniiplasma somnilux TaxID=215578 RepID=A0A2K8NXU9_9MOLU|nr:phenylalanine--tRNA ligase subunit alpha [Williamsoniiplasma somnilux]ATZ18649.1 phenylalanyl-tRNA synthetase subunit alpha [Williamsoniiplasma somnilux]